MATDDPKDVRKEFNRVKDNAGLEHRLKNVPDHHRAPPGASGTEHAFTPPGPGDPSQRTYKRRPRPQQNRDQQPKAMDRSPEQSDGPQKRKPFQKRLTRYFNERSR